MSLTRRSFLGTSAMAGISLFDPNIVLGADKTLTIALPNNPSTLDPIQISNHDCDGDQQRGVREPAGSRSRRQCGAVTRARDAGDVRRPDDLQVRPARRRGVPGRIEIQRRGREVLLRIHARSEEQVGAPDAVRADPGDRDREPDAHRVQDEASVSPVVPVHDEVHGHLPEGEPREASATMSSRTRRSGVGTGPGVFVEWKQNDYLEREEEPELLAQGRAGMGPHGGRRSCPKTRRASPI